MPITIDLSGKLALVTGGTRGIGRSISMRLAQAGARVAMMYREDDASARSAEAALESAFGSGSFAVRGDLAKADDAARVIAEVAERFDGGLDILVLNAGIGTRGGPFVHLSADEWRRPFDVNVDGHVAVLKAAFPVLRRGSSVVFISSGAGHDPLEGLSAYGASKAAVNHLAGVLAQEWGPSGVRVNTVSPGSTAKEPLDYEHLSAGQKETVAGTALRRLGTADDIADTVLYFASDLSSFVTGQWIRVNGGRI